MLKSHARFHSANGKRRVLVADDEAINRALLTAALEDEYEVICAEDGPGALAAIRENRAALSLVLLDLMMPGMSGLDLLRRMRDDQDLRPIPVIVVTSDQDAEVESLRLGAIDFIPKPYPQQDVILARVQRTIELSEDRDIILSTERDPVTDLYNREYFYRYARQFDQHHPGLAMDAIVVDVNHFHMINERFGTAYGDAVLRRIGEHLREMVKDAGGIVCRREADTFLVYCPHRTDYEDILGAASQDLASGDFAGGRVHLRMGVCSESDKLPEIERRFDRAKLAADTVRGSFSRSVGFYDREMHERELLQEQLIGDFRDAVREGQFEVFYQPKYDVRGETPVLHSAEALVRWRHPKLGLISPGVFIPLFESNGLIGELDACVWRGAARQIADWKRRFGCTLPVSVNVSRIDMYDPHLLETLQGILRENGLEASCLLLEITESAYTQDSEQIIETVSRLRRQGFSIEMDDFGTGYSSLNMLSALPIDALKMDMRFIRSAFAGQRDTRLLEIILELADCLGVPTIAEGVETQEQMSALRAMGCSFVQGYYFSRPVPPAEFERFLEARSALGRDARGGAAPGAERQPETLLRRAAYARIARALAKDYFSIYCVDMETGRFIEYSARGEYAKLGIEDSGEDFFGISRENIRRVAHPEDVQRLLKTFTKENVARALEENGAFTITYRLMLGGEPTYVHLKATRMEEDDPNIVIGISDIDAQMKREQRFSAELRAAQEKANRDALTGVKSKYAFAEAEAQWNGRMASGEAAAFAVAVCDVNGLKRVNDTQGHKAGDDYLRAACRTVCETFKHSPVFRIGGDEFAAILSGTDYENRAGLLQALADGNRQRSLEGGPVVACGIAERREEDRTFEEVFTRADERMYQEKKILKDEEDPA